MEQSGWSRKETIQHINSTRARTGASTENYRLLRLWEVPEEEQDKYFTIGFSKSISAKYSKDQVQTRRMLFNKDLFMERIEPYLGRKWCFTATTSWEEFKKLFDGMDKIIYKPRADTGGNGIKVYEIDEEHSLKDAYDEIVDKPFGVVEEFLIQHPEMQKFSVSSVNTLRFVTIRTNDPSKGIETGKVHFIYGGMRMAGGESYVDNLHSGGMIAAFDIDTGEIVTDATDHMNNVYETHPATGAVFKGTVIPYFQESKELIEKVSLGLDLEGYIGWDIAIGVDGPVLIEANNNPGSDILQLPYVPTRVGKKYIFDDFV